MSYVGPGDVVSGAVGWYGLRAYNAAYATPGTNPCADLRRVSDNATMTMAILSTGIADFATALAWVGASSATVSKLYDQTGNGHDMAQATASRQPTLVFSAVSSYYGVLSFSGSTQYLRAGSYNNTSAKITISGYVNVDSTGATYGSLFTLDISDGGYNALYKSATSNKLSLYGSNAISGTVAMDAWHAVQGVINGSSSVLYADGSSVASGNAGSDTFNSTPEIGGGVESAYLKGQIAEIGWWSTNFTSTQAGNVSSNQSAYYATAPSTPVIATGAVAFEALVAAGAATQANAGSAATAFGAMSSAGTVTQTNAAAGAVAFGALLAAGIATGPNIGVGAASFGAVTATATAGQANGAIAAPAFGSLSAVGTVIQIVSTSGAAALSSLAADGMASQSVAAGGAVTFGALSVAASATRSNPTTADVTLGTLSIAAAATQSNLVGADVMLGALSVVAAAIQRNPAATDVALGALSIAASATPSNPASADITLGTLSIVVAATQWNPATADITLSRLSVAASATRSNPATADVTLGALSITAVATQSNPAATDVTLGALSALAYLDAGDAFPPSLQRTHRVSLPGARRVVSVAAPIRRIRISASRRSISLYERWNHP